MTKFTLPMKSDKKGESPVFAMRYDRNYREKLKELDAADVNLADMIRPIFYQKIDRALKELQKRRQ